MLRFVCVTLLFSSTGFILEILGDIKLDGSGRGFDEESSNYETTLFRQLYYVVVTLSTVGQGLTHAPFKAQLEDLRELGNTSLHVELKLSTFGPRPQVNLGYMGDKVSLCRAECGKVSSS
jgi:hypothetical protein